MQLYTERLEAKDPVRVVTLPAASGEGQDMLWMPAQRRWTGEPDAPVRPVASWWPTVVPPAPRGPTTADEWQNERDAYFAP